MVINFFPAGNSLRARPDEFYLIHRHGDGQKNIRAENDAGYELLATLLHCWQTCYGDHAVTLNVPVRDIMLRAVDTPSVVTPANEWNNLRDALAAFASRSDGTRLDQKRIGNALRTIRGRVLGGQRFVQDGTYHRAPKWKVQSL